MLFPFIDLQSQQDRIKDKIDTAMARVLAHGSYILGPEVGQFETALASFTGADHVVACANGTDALILPMMAWGIGPGDCVFCPSFTYTASAEAIALLGATPVFVDVDPDTYTLCPASLKAAIGMVKAQGALTAKAVMCVDLFGRSADYPKIAPIARAHGLKIIADTAQSVGCLLPTENGPKGPVHWADVSTASFFPAKPLGCYGDGGAVMVKDAALVETLRSLAFHGRSKTPYDHDKIGLNSRLDTLQAAILLEKLAIFGDEIKARTRIAARYAQAFLPLGIVCPQLADGEVSSWAQYTIEIPARDNLMTNMRAAGLPVAAYYPRPVHQQTIYGQYPVAGNGLPVTNALSTKVVSLPMHPYLNPEHQDMVIEAVCGHMKSAAGSV